MIDWLHKIQFLIDKYPFVGNFLYSFFFVIVLIGTKHFATKKITSKKSVSSDLRRNLSAQIRNLSFFIFFIGLAIIWGSELRTVAVSLVAVAAAIVIATKELILCFTGGFYKLITQPFRIGDRIEVEEFRGDVIENDFLTTTLLEIGPKGMGHQYTGRSLTIPNSVFLDSTVINESFTHTYVLHIFVVPLKKDENRQLHEECLLDAAKKVCEAIIPEARKHMSKLKKNKDLDVPSVEPRITLHLPAPDRLDLLMRVPTPASQKGKIEQEILRLYLELLKKREA